MGLHAMCFALLAAACASSKDARESIRAAAAIDAVHVDSTSVPYRWSASEWVFAPVSETMVGATERADRYAATHLAVRPIVSRSSSTTPEDLVRLRTVLIEQLLEARVPLAPAIVLNHGWTGPEVQIVVTEFLQSTVTDRMEDSAERSLEMERPWRSKAYVTLSSRGEGQWWAWESEHSDVGASSIAASEPHPRSAEGSVGHLTGLSESIVAEIVHRIRTDPRTRAWWP